VAVADQGRILAGVDDQTREQLRRQASELLDLGDFTGIQQLAQELAALPGGAGLRRLSSGLEQALSAVDILAAQGWLRRLVEEVSP
jgi:hypothetical protein